MGRAAAAVASLAATVVLLVLTEIRARRVALSADSSVDSIDSQLQGARAMFAREQPVPATGNHPHGPPASRAKARGSRGRVARVGVPASNTLGLGSTMQKQFMRKVDSAVTRKVAHELILTMRPLKKILHEQQRKIEVMQRQKQQEKQVEEKLARALAEKLKKGLIAHLKQDVDIEVHRKLTPKALLKYEKAKSALRQKLRVLKAQQTAASHATAASGPGTATAAKRTLSSRSPTTLKKSEKDVESKKARGVHPLLQKTAGARQHAKKRPRMTNVQANVAKEIAAAKGVREDKSSPQAEVAKEISRAKGGSAAKSKKDCDPLSGLFTTGLVSHCSR